MWENTVPVMEWAGKLTVIGLLALLAVAIIMGYLRLPREVEELRAEKDRQLAEKDRLLREKDAEIREWKQLALAGTRVAAKAVQVADASTVRPPQGAVHVTQQQPRPGGSAGADTKGS